MPPADLARRFEEIIGRDVGRNIGALVDAAAGGLERAAGALADARAVTILTGFYIHRAVPPAAETDGPIGAVFLARALAERGVSVRVVTDGPCAPVVRAALDAHGLRASVPLEVVAVDRFAGGETLEVVLARHMAAPPSHVVSIERCGPGVGGVPRNARGEDVRAYTAPLERFFVPPAYRIAIGDGGNELGMGALSPELIAAHVAHGEQVACRVPADALIVAGVSNWGGAALALLVGGARAAAHVGGAAHDRLLAAIAAAGAVDGITRAHTRTVDGVPANEHRDLVDALAAAVSA